MDKKKVFIKIPEYLSNLYLILIITVLPLIFHNKYFDMVRTKADTFIYITGCIALLFIAFKLVSLMLNQDTQVINANPTDKFVLTFLILSIIATVFSENAQEAMWGTAGWHVGTSFFILCGIAYFLISRYSVWNYKFSMIAVAVNMIVLILGMLNAVGIDPLEMNRDVSPSDYGKYLSTIGNVNWYAGYLCMVLSLCTIIFFLSKNIAVRFMSAIILILCVINGIACNSDGFFFGIIPIAIYILFAALKSKEGLEHFIELLVVVELSLIFTVILKKYFIVNLDSLQDGVSSYATILILSLLMIAVIILNMTNTKTIFKYSKKIAWGIIIIFILTILIMIAVANIGSESINNPLLNKFKLYGAWGTNRGYIWKYSLEIFSKLNPLQMLFGTGPDTFGIAFRKYYYDEMINIWHKNVINAHCELLQLLITNGILGVIAYYGVFISGVKSFFKRDNIMLHAIAVAILSYLCQGMINNIQGMCTPFVFILLGLGMSIVLKNEINE